MAIPFNNNLTWKNYAIYPDWHASLTEPMGGTENQVNKSAKGIFKHIGNQFGARGVQFIRDGARLVLKVPVRSLLTPIFLPKNWKQRERAKINAKLAGHAFVQLLIVPAKFLIALTTLVKLGVFFKKSNELLDRLEQQTDRLDGRASQLEALKEVGRIHAKDRQEYNGYKKWLYRIDPKLCRKEGSVNTKFKSLD